MSRVSHLMIPSLRSTRQAVGETAGLGPLSRGQRILIPSTSTVEQALQAYEDYLEHESDYRVLTREAPGKLGEISSLRVGRVFTSARSKVLGLIL